MIKPQKMLPCFRKRIVPTRRTTLSQELNCTGNQNHTENNTSKAQEGLEASTTELPISATTGGLRSSARPTSSSFLAIASKETQNKEDKKKKL